jgi:hypothetical protein
MDVSGDSDDMSGDVDLLGLNPEMLIDSPFRRQANSCPETEPTFMSDLAKIADTLNDDWVKQLAGMVPQPAKATPTLSIVSNNQICMADNFLVHMSSMAEHSKASQALIFVALDKRSMEYCNTHAAPESTTWLSVHCLDISGLVPEVHGNQKFDACPYVLATWSKPVVLLHAIQAFPQGALLTDTDVLWRDNLFPWLNERHESDGAMWASDEGKGRVNTGVMFATQNHTGLIKEWLKTTKDPSIVSRGTGEQVGLQKVVGNSTNPKALRIIPRTVIGQCASGGSHATHYNGRSKLFVLRKDHAWKPRIPHC